MDYKLKTLDNGLRLLTVEIPSLQSVSVTVWIKTGSRSDYTDKKGISHFIEHMVFKGTKNRPTAAEISYAIDSIGAEFDAATAKDWTNYFLKVRSDLLETAFDLLSDVTLNPLFKRAGIERERGVILEELAMKEDSPMSKVGLNLMKLVFSGHPLGNDIGGVPKTVKSIQKDDLIRYRKDHYSSENIVITVSGSVKEPEATKLVEKYFKRLKKGKKKRITKFVNRQRKPKLYLEYKKSEQAHFYLAFLGNSRDYEKRHAEAVLLTLLGRGMSSRLFTEVREKRGLAYAIGSSVSRFADTGVFASYAGVDVDKISKAIEVMLSEHTSIVSKKQPITKKELEKAKEYIKGRVALSLEDTASVNSFFGQRVLFLDKIRTPEEVYKKIDEVKADDVYEVARKMFKKERLNLAIIGPYKDKSRFEKLIK
jgi:predicted Zn-dependent peptidase